jgi:NAD(P)-dependent dehydrogenase (short-subunit alcohol dehydrogenase family)
VLARFSAVGSQFGPIGALVNSAGAVDVAARVDEMTSERWQRMFAINVFGTMRCAREAVRRMSTRHGGEGGTEGIRVTAVRPGILDTEIHASGGEPDRATRLASAIPMLRAGTAEEVAEAILWLASGESSYATGAILDVSGGR